MTCEKEGCGESIYTCVRDWDLCEKHYLKLTELVYDWLSKKDASQATADFEALVKDHKRRTKNRTVAG